MDLGLAAFVISAIALVIACVSLAFLTVWRSVHPDVSALRSDLNATKMDMGDMLDRWQHAQRRQSVRDTRARQEETQGDDPWPKSALSKHELRVAHNRRLMQERGEA